VWKYPETTESAKKDKKMAKKKLSDDSFCWKLTADKEQLLFDTTSTQQSVVWKETAG